jgi:hypothetical protein
MHYFALRIYVDVAVLSFFSRYRHLKVDDGLRLP